MHRIMVALAMVVVAAAPGCGDLEETTNDQQSPAYSSTGERVDDAAQEIGGSLSAFFPFNVTL